MLTRYDIVAYEIELTDEGFNLQSHERYFERSTDLC